MVVEVMKAAQELILAKAEEPGFEGFAQLTNDPHTLDMFMKNFQVPGGESIDPQEFLRLRLEAVGAPRSTTPQIHDAEAVHSETWHTANK